MFFAVIEAVGIAYLAPCLVGMCLAAEAFSVSANLTSEIGPRLVTVYISQVHVASVEARHYACSLPQLATVELFVLRDRAIGCQCACSFSLARSGGCRGSPLPLLSSFQDCFHSEMCLAPFFGWGGVRGRGEAKVYYAGAMSAELRDGTTVGL